MAKGDAPRYSKKVMNRDNRRSEATYVISCRFNDYQKLDNHVDRNIKIEKSRWFEIMIRNNLSE